MNSEKKLIPLADYFHQLATIHGVATFELADHTLLAKQHVPATWFTDYIWSFEFKQQKGQVMSPHKQNPDINIEATDLIFLLLGGRSWWRAHPCIVPLRSFSHAIWEMQCLQACAPARWSERQAVHWPFVMINVRVDGFSWPLGLQIWEPLSMASSASFHRARRLGLCGRWEGK